jgi:hypothetical protein
VLPQAGLPLLAWIGLYAAADGKMPATMPAVTEVRLVDPAGPLIEPGYSPRMLRPPSVRDSFTI